MSQLLGLAGAAITGAAIYISYITHSAIPLYLWGAAGFIGTFVFLYKLWKLGKPWEG